MRLRCRSQFSDTEVGSLFVKVVVIAKECEMQVKLLKNQLWEGLAIFAGQGHITQVWH